MNSLMPRRAPCPIELLQSEFKRSEHVRDLFVRYSETLLSLVQPAGSSSTWSRAIGRLSRGNARAPSLAKRRIRCSLEGDSLNKSRQRFLGRIAKSSALGSRLSLILLLQPDNPPRRIRWHRKPRRRDMSRRGKGHWKPFKSQRQPMIGTGSPTQPPYP